jgi:hypothetical protein
VTGIVIASGAASRATAAPSVLMDLNMVYLLRGEGDVKWRFIAKWCSLWKLLASKLNLWLTLLSPFLSRRDAPQTPSVRASSIGRHCGI